VCALSRPTIPGARSLIMGVLAPIAGAGFAGWQIVTESASAFGVLLVVVFVAPWAAEPIARRWLDSLPAPPAAPPPAPPAPPSPGPPSPPSSEP
jgi:hypothetical protein